MLYTIQYCVLCYNVLSYVISYYITPYYILAHYIIFSLGIGFHDEACRSRANSWCRGSSAICRDVNVGLGFRVFKQEAY